MKKGSPKKAPSPKKRPASQPVQYAKRAKVQTAQKPPGFAHTLAKIDGEQEEDVICTSSTNPSNTSATAAAKPNVTAISKMHLFKPINNPTQHEEKWARPEVEEWLREGGNQQPLYFQLVDLDYYIDRGTSLVVRMFGVTRSGNSIAVCATGYRPYFYASAPQGFGQEHVPRAVEAMNRSVKAFPQSGLNPDVPVVTGIELVQGANFYYYTAERNMLFLKIFVASPRLISGCRNALGAIDQMFPNQANICRPFESNIDFEVRFISDREIVGCGWIECPAGKYTPIKQQNKLSCCQIEVSLPVEDVKAHDASIPEWSVIAPLRTLSFDIECMGPMGTFPDANRDPVIQIANMVKLEGQTEPFIRNCFVLGTCEPIVGSDVYECRTEEELLNKWADFVRRVDPDLLTGYNIQNFDLPYIMDRAKVLKIDNRVCYLSRVRGNICKQRDASLQSKQMGNRINRMCSMDGRIIFDVMQVILRDYKLRSYSLNNVSYFFLGEQKEDVAYNFIPELQNGSPHDRRRLALYCMKDAYLPLRLLDKLMLIINYMEMARVTGVPLNFLITRGQQVKILSMILRKTRRLNLFLPVIESGEGGDEVGYEGATVIEPICDFYNEPIATLDFASLYPSIMIAHNLCYTTLVKKPPPGMTEGVDYIRTPSGDLFIHQKHRRGLLPQILEELLAARKKAKADLKKETDPLRQMVLNGRQMALKVSANSVYGFTGASRGKLPCVEISQSVTAFGRQMIEQTKREVEAFYTEGACDGACPVNAKVIYGDTDSVMVKFGVKTVAEAMLLGRHAAQEISKHFVRPIQLEFEKVYFPYLLINKKRYAGLFWTREEKFDKMDCKGLETVRRDNCPLVASVLNVCLEKLLIDRDKHGALNYAKAVISDLLCGKIDISMLTITKELTKKGEKYAAKQAHVELAERMRKRDPGSAPRLGDRVPYVIVNKGTNVPAYEKAEDPIWVLEHNVPIDTTYYLEHQLVKPLVRIFEPILGNRAENYLLNGDHTKKKAVTKLKTGLMAGYFAKKSSCLACKTPMDMDEEEAPATCPNCRGKTRSIYLEKIMAIRLAEYRFGRLWTECQNCAGMLQGEVFCASRDCPIFYMREKVRNDLEELERTFRRFQVQSGEAPLFSKDENGGN